MAKRPLTNISGQKNLPNLMVSLVDAENKLSLQIDKGKKLLGLPIRSVEEFKSVYYEHYNSWNDFNTTLLKVLFTTPELSGEYSGCEYGGHISFEPFFYEEGVENYRNKVENKISKLKSIKERLPFYGETLSPLPESGEKRSTVISKEVFVVHGHDNAPKEAVARFLEKLELEPVILHEQPDKGRTIIEKFEEHSSVVYAVVLLTPDDIGALLPISSGGHTIYSERHKASPRARQNVIFELGYFIGKLGRRRVCALYKEGVERPSDLHGVLYIPLDEAGAWRLKLAKELKAVGLNVDLNKIET